MFIFSLSKTELKLRTCRKTCTKGKPCIRKCCPADMIYSKGGVGRGKCVDSGETKWSPKLYRDPSDPQTLIPMEEGTPPTILYSPPPAWRHNCFEKVILLHPFSEEVAEALHLNLCTPEALQV
jgi:hypothetical protein